MCQINRTFDKYIDILNTAGRVLIIGKHDKKDKPRAPERDSGHNEDYRVQKHSTSKSFKYTWFPQLLNVVGGGLHSLLSLVNLIFFVYPI